LWQYGIEYKEWEELTHKLERAQNIINEPQSFWNKIPPISEAEALLIELKQILESKQKISENNTNKQNPKLIEPEKNEELNQAWTEMINGRDSRFVTLVEVVGGKIINVEKLASTSQGPKFQKIDFNPGKGIEIGKSGRQFIIDQKEQNLIRASWGGRDAFEWEFGDDGLYAFGRDISNIMIIARHENGIVYPIQALTGYYAQPIESTPPKNQDTGKELSSEELLEELAKKFNVVTKKKQ